MFAKKHRLGKTKDIQQAFARGRSFFYPFFVIKFVPKSGPARFTVVVSTKVSKKAVTRNRLKRIIRECVRLNLKSLATGDYVIIVKLAAVRLEAKDLREKIFKALLAAKLLHI